MLNMALKTKNEDYTDLIKDAQFPDLHRALQTLDGGGGRGHLSGFLTNHCRCHSALPS
jgi:hypothetical protein